MTLYLRENSLYGKLPSFCSSFLPGVFTGVRLQPAVTNLFNDFLLQPYFGEIKLKYSRLGLSNVQTNSTTLGEILYLAWCMQ